MVTIGNDWDELLKDEWDKPYYKKLREFLIDEYKNETVYPPAEDIFNALRLTPYSDVKVVILGQDPYHEPGEAHGLAFSVQDGVAVPPSLLNIFKELKNDLGISAGSEDDAEDINDGGHDASEIPDEQAGEDETVQEPALRGNLEKWARQGVLLLNTVLTVRAHQAGSHRGRGWEQFTDKVIELLAARSTPMVFVLWGVNAAAKKDIIINAQTSDASGNTGGSLRHLIITAPHPSPLSAYRGFFGGRYFSRCNYFLKDNGIETVDWVLQMQ